MLNTNIKEIESVVNSLEKRGFFRGGSPFLFLVDFNEKMELSFGLIRRYFQTDKLDDIAFDIVKAYCLRDGYSLDNVINLEDTDADFCSFFEKYVQSFVKMARYVESDSKSRRR